MSKVIVGKLVIGSSHDRAELIEWEMRPGGMLIQRRDMVGTNATVTGPLINLRVSYDLSFHEIMVPPQASFGEVKRLLVQETGLRPHKQRILFRGKEKEDSEFLHEAGVKDKSKVILLEDPTSRERNLEKIKRSEITLRACKAVAAVSSEVDKLGGQLSIMEGAVHTGNKVPENNFNVLSEMLMRQLLKLDSIEANGEAKTQRRSQVRRVQNFVEVVDGLKVRNSKLQSQEQRLKQV